MSGQLQYHLQICIQWPIIRQMYCIEKKKATSSDSQFLQYVCILTYIHVHRLVLLFGWAFTTPWSVFTPLREKMWVTLTVLVPFLRKELTCILSCKLKRGCIHVSASRSPNYSNEWGQGLNPDVLSIRSSCLLLIRDRERQTQRNHGAHCFLLHVGIMWAIQKKDKSWLTSMYSTLIALSLKQNRGTEVTRVLIGN